MVRQASLDQESSPKRQANPKPEVQNPENRQHSRGNIENPKTQGNGHWEKAGTDNDKVALDKGKTQAGS